MEQRRLIFGIMCNSLTLQRWQANAITALLQHPAFEARLVLLNNNPPQKQPLHKKLFSPTLFFTQYENRVLKIPARQPVDMTDVLGNIPPLHIKTVQKGKYSHYFNDADIETIKAAGLDFIIRFGFGILKGEILNAARHGVWSYHHGDEKDFRGGPPGFWELFYNKPTTAVLQRLTATLDGGVILKRGTFKTVHHSYTEQLDTLLNHTSEWIKLAGLQLLADGLRLEENTMPAGKINKAPHNFTLLLFFAKLFCNKVRFKFNSLFRTELWNIGTLNNTVGDILKKKQLSVSWLPGDKDTFAYRADPFVLQGKANTIYFFERYDYRNKKGHIASIEYDAASRQYLPEKAVLKPGAHLSYPFVFSHNGKNYCIPENFETNSAVLYEIEADNSLKKAATLIEGLPVVDPTLLFHHNKFWLFCTLKNSLPNAQLYIFYSEQLEGPYLPHLLNPVKTDVGSARPAGNFFYHNGQLARPAQNCSHTYGGSLVLNRILKLTETEFVEEKLAEVFPFDKEYNKGIHHLSVSDTVLAVDGKKYIFSLQKLFKKQNRH